jgi:hypothetical protein
LKDRSEEEIDRLPKQLRALLQEELEAGNEIVEIGHSYPAAPAGLYVKLARLVTTRPRESKGGIEFYDRDTPYYSGEFNDPKRLFFILEPPRSIVPVPEKDAIQEVDSTDHSGKSFSKIQSIEITGDGPVERFERSMAIDHEKWHDGKDMISRRSNRRPQVNEGP